MARNVTVYDARRYSDFREDEGGRWVTFCQKHGTFVQHETRALAYNWAKVPAEWCAECFDDIGEEDAPRH